MYRIHKVRKNVVTDFFFFTYLLPVSKLHCIMTVHKKYPIGRFNFQINDTHALDCLSKQYHAGEPHVM